MLLAFAALSGFLYGVFMFKRLTLPVYLLGLVALMGLNTFLAGL